MLVLPALERLVTQLAVISYCLPIVAIGPLAFIVIGSPARGEASGTAVLLAGISVFFTTVVGALSALKSADQASLDLVAVYGGGRFKQLVKVQLISALPGILTALKIAVPAAVLGAVLGEYVGGWTAGSARRWSTPNRTWRLPGPGASPWSRDSWPAPATASSPLIARFVTPWSAGARRASR